MERDNKYVGCRYQIKNCGEVEVISYKSYSKVEILFLQTGNIVTTNMWNVKLGQVKDRSFGNISGGCSLGKLELKTGLLYKKSYVTWGNVVSRCYRSKAKAYAQCEMSDYFKNYENFEKWWVNQIGCDQEDWHLDKDILVKGNKVYSEDTCCFVPREINNLLTLRRLKRGNYLIGVCKKGRGFGSSLTKHGKSVWLGTFDTEIEAFQAYKQAKEDYIKDVANKWKDQIDPRAYEALMNYQVEITD